MRFSRLALILVALTLATPGCRQDSSTKQPVNKVGKRESKAAIVLPDPLPLPAEPAGAAYLAEPSRALAMLEPYSPYPIDGRALTAQALSTITAPDLSQDIAGAVDLRGAIGYVAISREQEVIRLAVRNDAREDLAARLAKLEAVGNFGAVRLPAPGLAPIDDEGQARAPSSGGRTWLAWIDHDDGGVLVLANSVEGLVTARSLTPAYGREAVYFTTDLSLSPMPIDVPFSRISGHGSLEQLDLELTPLAGQDPLSEFPIAPGTLAGLLATRDIALGVSGRYSEHEQVVRQVTSEVNAQVRELPFLVKGIGEDLAAKLNTTLRSWDGRVLVALGPAHHLRVAYGSPDTKKAGIAAIRLLQSVVDNVSFGRNFISQLPKLSLRRRVATVEGVDVELFVVHDANGLVPAELRSLVDGEGRLNVAMAWSEHGGGGMIVVGPEAVAQLSSWLEQSRGAPSHGESASQLLAAAIAATPEALQSLMSNPEVDPRTLLGIGAQGPRWDLAVTRAGDGRFELAVHMPGPPKPPRAKVEQASR